MCAIDWVVHTCFTQIIKYIGYNGCWFLFCGHFGGKGSLNTGISEILQVSNKPWSLTGTLYPGCPWLLYRCLVICYRCQLNCKPKLTTNKITSTFHVSTCLCVYLIYKQFQAFCRKWMRNCSHHGTPFMFSHPVGKELIVRLPRNLLRWHWLNGPVTPWPIRFSEKI